MGPIVGREVMGVQMVQQITHKGIPIRMTADLSVDTLQARREWQDILKVMKEKTYNQITIPSKDLIQILRRN